MQILTRRSFAPVMRNEIGMDPLLRNYCKNVVKIGGVGTIDWYPVDAIAVSCCGDSREGSQKGRKDQENDDGSDRRQSRCRTTDSEPSSYFLIF